MTILFFVIRFVFGVFVELREFNQNKPALKIKLGFCRYLKSHAAISTKTLFRIL